MSRPPGIWALLRIFGAQDQKEFSNEFWYSISAGSPPSSWDRHAAAGVLYNAIASPLLATMSANCSLKGAEFYYNDGTGTLGVDYYQTHNSSAILSGIPEDVAVVVQKLTTNTTKKGRGRWYFAGVATGFVQDSYLNSGGITSYQALAVQLKTAVTDQTITYSPAHYSPGLNMLFPIADTPVIALLATRRRRRFGF
jgi:hypothetical protein